MNNKTELQKKHLLKYAKSLCLLCEANNGNSLDIIIQKAKDGSLQDSWKKKTIPDEFGLSSKEVEDLISYNVFEPELDEASQRAETKYKFSKPTLAAFVEFFIPKQYDSSNAIVKKMQDTVLDIRHKLNYSNLEKSIKAFNEDGSLSNSSTDTIIKNKAKTNINEVVNSFTTIINLWHEFRYSIFREIHETDDEVRNQNSALIGLWRTYNLQKDILTVSSTISIDSDSELNQNNFIKDANKFINKLPMAYDEKNTELKRLTEEMERFASWQTTQNGLNKFITPLIKAVDDEHAKYRDLSKRGIEAQKVLDALKAINDRYYHNIEAQNVVEHKIEQDLYVLEKKCPELIVQNATFYKKPQLLIDNYYDYEIEAFDESDIEKSYTRQEQVSQGDLFSDDGDDVVEEEDNSIDTETDEDGNTVYRAVRYGLYEQLERNLLFINNWREAREIGLASLDKRLSKSTKNDTKPKKQVEVAQFVEEEGELYKDAGGEYIQKLQMLIKLQVENLIAQKKSKTVNVQLNKELFDIFKKDIEKDGKVKLTQDYNIDYVVNKCIANNVVLWADDMGDFEDFEVRLWHTLNNSYLKKYLDINIGSHSSKYFEKELSNENIIGSDTPSIIIKVQKR